MRYFLDVHRKARKRGDADDGWRITFTTDGEEFAHCHSPTEIPATNGDQVFVDVIPITHTDGFVELLRRGVDVYYLRRLSLVGEMRKKLGLSKTARNDIRVLMKLEGKWFKKVSEDFLIMRRLINGFRNLQKIHQRLLNYREAAGLPITDSIDSIDREMESVAEKIVDEAGRRYPAYNKLVESLGLTGENHLLGREALAEVVAYIDPSKGFRKTMRYFGLFRLDETGRKRRRKRLFHGQNRSAILRLTMAINNSTPTHKDARKLLLTVWKTIRQTHGRLADIPA